MSRNTRRLLALSTYLTAPSLALKFEGDDKGGGGADDKGKADKGKDAKDQPKKIELTEDELTSRTQSAVDAALKKQADEHAAKLKKDQDEAERKKAEEQGEFKTLATKAQEKADAAEAERDAAKLEAKALTVKDQLRDHLADKHPEYVGVAKYIMPLVTFDLKTEQKDIDARIKDASEQYVKDNPRKAAGHTPGNPSRNTARENTEAPAKKANNGNVHAPASRF